MKENGVPLVLTYNPNYNSLSFLIRKNLQFLYAHPETQSICKREKQVLQNAMVNAAKYV